MSLLMEKPVGVDLLLARLHRPVVPGNHSLMSCISEVLELLNHSVP